MNKHHIITAHTLTIQCNSIRTTFDHCYAQLDKMIDALEQVCQTNKALVYAIVQRQTVIGSVLKGNKQVSEDKTRTLANNGRNIRNLLTNFSFVKMVLDLECLNSGFC